MQADRLNHLREEILKSRDEILKSVSGIDDQISGFRGAQPAEFNERGEEEAAIQILAQLDYRQKKELSLIEEALARMQSGTYGICWHCGNDIPEDRLLALPFTTICKICAVKQAPD